MCFERLSTVLSSQSEAEDFRAKKGLPLEKYYQLLEPHSRQSLLQLLSCLRHSTKETGCNPGEIGHPWGESLYFARVTKERNEAT